MVDKDPTSELPDLDALDALDGADAPEPVDADKAEVEGEAAVSPSDADPSASTEDADEIFEALAAKDPAKAEKYVAFLEAEAAKAADAAKPKAEVIELTPEEDDASDIGIDPVAEQEMNAAAFRAELVKKDQEFASTTINQLFTRGQTLYGRYQRAVERHGAESEEASEAAQDYIEVKNAHEQAQKIRQSNATAIRMLDGIETLVKAAPALKPYRAAITKLVDSGKLDPFAPSSEIKAVLRQHLPKVAAKPGAKAGKPSADKIAELRKRLGSSKGSGSTAAQAIDGAPRKASSGPKYKVSADTQKALDLIGGGRKTGTR